MRHAADDVSASADAGTKYAYLPSSSQALARQDKPVPSASAGMGDISHQQPDNVVRQPIEAVWTTHQLVEIITAKGVPSQVKFNEICCSTLFQSLKECLHYLTQLSIPLI